MEKLKGAEGDCRQLERGVNGSLMKEMCSDVDDALEESCGCLDVSLVREAYL